MKRKVKVNVTGAAVTAATEALRSTGTDPAYWNPVALAMQDAFPGAGMFWFRRDGDGELFFKAVVSRASQGRMVDPKPPKRGARKDKPALRRIALPPEAARAARAFHETRTCPFFSFEVTVDE